MSHLLVKLHLRFAELREACRSPFTLVQHVTPYRDISTKRQARLC